MAHDKKEVEATLKYRYARFFDDTSGDVTLYENLADAEQDYDSDLEHSQHVVMLLLFDVDNSYALRYNYFGPPLTIGSPKVEIKPKSEIEI